VWKDFKAPVAVIAFVVTLGVAMAGYSLYNRYLVEKPVQEEMSRVPGVQEVEINRENHKVTVTVTLEDMEDFAPSYRDVDKLAKERFGEGNYSLEIKDTRNQELEEVYRGLQLYLYQGIANNSFLWLNQEINKVAREHQLKYKLSVDEDNLYLQLHKQGHYLYEVIKRGEDNSSEPAVGR